MKVGIIQSCYIPWRGYFDFIDSVDLFIFHDDLQYTVDWRNRNKIKTPRGLVWLSVPVRHKSSSQLICETTIDYSQNWQRKHINRFRENYRKAPYYDFVAGEYFDIISERYDTISDLNVVLTKWIMGKLGIVTPIRMSMEFAPQGRKTERLLDLLTKVGATTYVSGPTAKNYLDEDLFREAGIRLEYKSYDYPPYPQLWGEFVGNVTVLDLLANTGPKARDFLKSRSPNEVAVE
ncbi:hypothetical protein D6779_12100 [Candidatus Parcubacteria bacterium]|nr:MAG: hypothetical protein D6779_12100 [Candidatus Parcubacteria bacterium]